MKLGIVGLGLMGSGHARSILAGLVPGCELAAVCDRAEVVSDEFAGVPYFEDPVALLSFTGLNATGALRESPERLPKPPGSREPPFFYCNIFPKKRLTPPCLRVSI